MSTERKGFEMKRLTSIVGMGLLCCLILSPALAGETSYHLGPTGLMGTISKTTITVTSVEKGSPADGKIKVKDLIVGAADRGFKKDVRRELADAIDEAETEKAGGKLTLNLVGGKKVELQLKVLGSYSETAPYNCPKSEAIIRQAADYLVASEKTGSEKIQVGLLGLMATGEKKYLDAAAKLIKEAEWAQSDGKPDEAALSGEKPTGYVTWYGGYELITLGEYYLLTKDESVLPAIQAKSVTLARGQDPGGLWGHRYATTARNGRLPGYAQMNQPSLSCFMGLLLAQKCGIKDPAFGQGVERTYTFYTTFIDKGTLPYGVHNPNSGGFNNNGMSASAALCMALKGNKEGAKYFSQISATSYDGLETGHANFFFNPLWTPLGAALSGPEVTQQFFRKSRWLYTMYRSWNGGFARNSDDKDVGPMAGSALLMYCLPRKTLCITGREADESIWVKGPAATSVIEMSKIDYKSKSVDELLSLFLHPIIQVRRNAIWALREKQGDFIPTLVKMMKEGTQNQKESAIGYFGYKCPPETALPRLDDLGAILRNTQEDPEVREAAAASLSCLGEPAYKYYGDMLKFLSEEKPADKLGMIDMGLGQSLSAICEDPFKAGLVTDKDTFYKAVTKLLDHKRQHARGAGMRLLQGMPIEDFHRVAEKVMHVVRDEDSTYHSYHNPGIAIEPAITILSGFNIKEGLPYALEMLNDDSGKWSFKVRAFCSALQRYGGHAKPILEKLKDDPRFKGIEENGKLKGSWTNLVKAIEEDQNPKPLISLEEAIRAGQGKK